jgi:hypothetical protein
MEIEGGWNVTLADIIGEAKGFVRDWRWYEITKVEILRRAGNKDLGADWIHNDQRGDARIEIGLRADIGCLFHEVFHCAFHAGPLHNGEDEKWGDAWCDAFRYFHDPDFKNKIDKYCEMTIDQAQGAADRSSDKSYAYPCSLIIKKCDHHDGKLKEMWFQLCKQRRESGKDVLRDYFGYDIEHGVALSCMSAQPVRLRRSTFRNVLKSIWRWFGKGRR